MYPLSALPQVVYEISSVVVLQQLILMQLQQGEGHSVQYLRSLL